MFINELSLGKKFIAEMAFLQLSPSLGKRFIAELSSSKKVHYWIVMKISPCLKTKSLLLNCPFPSCNLAWAIGKKFIAELSCAHGQESSSLNCHVGTCSLIVMQESVSLNENLLVYLQKCGPSHWQGNMWLWITVKCWKCYNPASVVP